MDESNNIYIAIFNNSFVKVTFKNKEIKLKATLNCPQIDLIDEIYNLFNLSNTDLYIKEKGTPHSYIKLLHTTNPISELIKSKTVYEIITKSKVKEKVNNERNIEIFKKIPFSRINENKQITIDSNSSMADLILFYNLENTNMKSVIFDLDKPFNFNLISNLLEKLKEKHVDLYKQNKESNNYKFFHMKFKIRSDKCLLSIIETFSYLQEKKISFESNSIKLFLDYQNSTLDVNNIISLLSKFNNNSLIDLVIKNADLIIVDVKNSESILKLNSIKLCDFYNNMTSLKKLEVIKQFLEKFDKENLTKISLYDFKILTPTHFTSIFSILFNKVKKLLIFKLKNINLQFDNNDSYIDLSDNGFSISKITEQNDIRSIHVKNSLIINKNENIFRNNFNFMYIDRFSLLDRPYINLVIKENNSYKLVLNSKILNTSYLCNTDLLINRSLNINKLGFEGLMISQSNISVINQGICLDKVLADDYISNIRELELNFVGFNSELDQNEFFTKCVSVEKLIINNLKSNTTIMLDKVLILTPNLDELEIRNTNFTINACKKENLKILKVDITELVYIFQNNDLDYKTEMDKIIKGLEHLFPKATTIYLENDSFREIKDIKPELINKNINKMIISNPNQSMLLSPFLKLCREIIISYETFCCLVYKEQSNLINFLSSNNEKIDKSLFESIKTNNYKVVIKCYNYSEITEIILSILIFYYGKEYIIKSNIISSYFIRQNQIIIDIENKYFKILSSLEEVISKDYEFTMNMKLLNKYSIFTKEIQQEVKDLKILTK